MAERIGAAVDGPRDADEAIRALLGILARHYDEIRDRFVADLRRRVDPEPGSTLQSDLAALAAMPEALRRAAGGDWLPLREQAGAIRALIGTHDVTRALVLDSLVALRRTVYPFLLGHGAAGAAGLVDLLGGFDRLIAWFVLGIPGGGGQLEIARDAMFLRSIVENIPYMIFVKDARDLRFVRFNRAGEELLGYGRDELIGKSDYDFFPVEEADFFTRHDRRVLDGRTLVDIPEEPIETRARGRRLLHTKKIPILGDDGAPLYLLGISEDITEQRGVRLELERAKASAEAASRAKSEFLARMSHEIRTPLNGIIGMTELALETEPTPEQRECLEVVRGSAESLLKVLNDVLDFSKVESGKLELEAIPFDLDASVRMTLKAFEPRARDKGVRLDYAATPDVPPGVVGDPVRLRQVLVNLLDNAVRFTERGRVRLRIGVDERTEHRVTLHFRVEDTGIGVPRDKQATIFESFTQADGSITRRFGGTGLGLTISGRLVELMGGRIWLESEPGRGSTFHFTAGVGVATDATVSLRDADEALPLARRLPQLSVLVAEDNLVNRTLIVRILQRHGHHVVEARDGSQVLAALERGAFDLVLMDVEMPHLGGIEATHRIRARERQSGGHVPIIALTAHVLPSDRERCLAAGMDGYVAKPVRRSALFSAIAAALPAAGAAHGASAPGDRPQDENTESLHDLFVRSARAELRRIRGALRQGSGAEARRLAHGMAGAACVVGAQEVGLRARDLERLIDGADPQRVSSACEALAAALSEFENANLGRDDPARPAPDA